MKHFNIIFSNPPYSNKFNKKIDEKIIKLTKKLSDFIILIHPMNCILNNNINNNLEQLIIFWGNSIFNINLFMPLCISFWNTTTDIKQTIITDKVFLNKKYKRNIKKFNIHPENLDLSFLTKIDSILNHKTKRDYSDVTNFNIKFAMIRGHTPNTYNQICNDFYTIASKNPKNNICDLSIINNKHNNKKNIMSTHMLLWSFNSYEESINFLNMCKTKFARFCLSLKKINGHLDTDALLYIPWLDFKQKWTDENLCQYFNISTDLWNYINNFIPNYYE